MGKNILLTGGSGYIGTHTCLSLLENGFDQIVVIDNLVNSDLQNIRNLENNFGIQIKFYESDLNDIDVLRKVFSENSISDVIHFAGLKSVKVSVSDPLYYYENNISGTVNLLKVMREFKCYNIIFSSSATVYGETLENPINENVKTAPINPYGRTKLFIEHILKDIYDASYPNENWSIIILRYFNPVSCSPLGILKELPKEKVGNLFPAIMDVYDGTKSHLTIFGKDCATIDGSPIRDYIHVSDLADAHVLSLKYLNNNSNTFEIFNVGTGKGLTVREIVDIFSETVGKEIKYVVADRRAGDAEISFASPEKINRMLGWSAKYTVAEMCAHCVSDSK